MSPASIELTPCTASDVDGLSAISTAIFIETFAGYYNAEDFSAFLHKAYAPGTLAEGVTNLSSTSCSAQIDGRIAEYAKINVGEA